MSNSPLNKLRRQPTLPPAVEDARQRLGKIGETNSDLAGITAATAALLRAMYEDVAKAPFPFSSEQVRIKAEGQVPLLRGETLALDRRWLQRRFEKLCRVMREQGHPAARPLEEAARQQRYDVAGMTVELLAGEPTTVAVTADELGLDAELAMTLLRLTLLPILEQIANAARPLRPEGVWTAGYCPTCGAWPVLGEYRGLEMTRFLRCGLCGDEWAVDRLLCFVCGSRTHFDLQYLEVAGEELKQRVRTCERCHSYVKQISTHGRIAPPGLLATDVETVHLDLIALERAYTTPQ